MRRTRLLYLIIACISFITVSAKDYSTIFHYPLGIKVNDISYLETATVVSLTYTGAPYSWIRLANSTYASDENSVRHHVIRTEGIQLGERLWIGDDGRVSFTLYFDPLPKGTKLFDIIEGDLLGGFYLYGIHKAGTKARIPKADSTMSEKEVEASAFKPDSAFIRGCFKGYSRQTMPELWLVGYRSFQVDPFDMSQSPTILKVEPDGTFHCGFLVDSPKWTYLDNWSNRHLNFYIRPGDTLDIQIDNFGQWNETISYKGVSGNSCHGNLMRYNKEAIWERLLELRNAASLTAFDHGIETLSEEVDALFDYLSWKYHLNAWEVHLLKSDWTLTAMAEKADFMESKAFSIPMEHLMPLKASADSIKIKDLYDYSFLKSELWEDASIRITPAFDRSADIAKRHGIVIPEYGDNLSADNSNAPEYSTFKVKDTLVQSLIDRITASTDSRYIEVAFMHPKYDKATGNYLSSLRNLTADFSESADIDFVAVIDEGQDEDATTLFARRLSLYCPCVITLAHEDFLSVQASLRQISVPFSLTLTKDGGIFHWPLFLSPETSFRDSFRQLIKREKDNEIPKD